MTTLCYHRSFYFPLALLSLFGKSGFVAVERFVGLLSSGFMTLDDVTVSRPINLGERCNAFEGC